MTNFEIALIGLGIGGLLIFIMAKVAERYERRPHHKGKHA
jgi:hypothetical protein